MTDSDGALRRGITIKEMMDDFGVTLGEAKALRGKLDDLQGELDERGYIIFQKPGSETTDTGNF